DLSLFFFQAEDGIRARTVTGVQTCALPISTNISAAQVKELRERSGAPMMDCKNALNEAKGDIEQALIVLRKKGIATAAKKAAREIGRASCRERVKRSEVAG